MLLHACFGLAPNWSCSRPSTHSMLAPRGPADCAAGFAYKGDAWGVEEAQTTINTNYVGTGAALLLPDLL